MEGQQKLMTVKEAACVLRLSRANVYSLVQQGKIPHVRIGKRRLFRVQDIDSFITQHVIA